MSGHDPDVLVMVARWLSYADEDLQWARHGFALTGGSPHRLIAYHAQQSVEKHLKACLMLRGVDFPFTHNIARLLELCAEHATWAAELKDAEELTPFAIEARYPGVEEDVTEAEARRAVDIAARVRTVVRAAMEAEGVGK